MDPEKKLDHDSSHATEPSKVLVNVIRQVIGQIRFVRSHARSLHALAVDNLVVSLIVEGRRDGRELWNSRSRHETPPFGKTRIVPLDSITI